jgi:hypothetical protein
LAGARGVREGSESGRLAGDVREPSERAAQAATSRSRRVEIAAREGSFGGDEQIYGVLPASL